MLKNTQPLINSRGIPKLEPDWNNQEGASKYSFNIFVYLKVVLKNLRRIKTLLMPKRRWSNFNAPRVKSAWVWENWKRKKKILFCASSHQWVCQFLLVASNFYSFTNIFRSHQIIKSYLFLSYFIFLTIVYN